MVKDNVVEFVMKDGNGAKHKLFYYLFDTPFISKWTELVRKNFDNPKHNIVSTLMNNSGDDYNNIRVEILECCHFLNKHGYGPELPIYETMNKPKLNNLHELFENWGTIRDDKKDPRSIIQSVWFNLNEAIHKCEDILTAKNLNTNLKMSGLIDIQPLGLHNDLTDQDKLLLTTEYKWGELYLGYNTQGKDYLTAMYSNDVRVIDNDEVKPQSRYAAESWQYFGMDHEPLYGSNQFSIWYETLPEATKKKIPLNDLTLGRVILGKLIPHKTPSCMDVDPNLLHWETSMHSCKDVWNKKYYSNFIECVAIKFHQLIPDEVENFIKESKLYAWRPEDEIDAQIPWGQPDLTKEHLPKDLWKSNWPWAPIDPFPNTQSVTNWNQRRINEELEKMDAHFVSHRAKDKLNSYSHEGWSAVTLHGISRERTENFDRYGFKTEEEANYQWVGETRNCPYLVDLIKKLPFKKLSRVRIMKLAPGGYIMPHNDAPGNNYKRMFGPMNIALTQPVGCDFVMEGIGLLPFIAGKGFILDVGHNHCLANKSNKNRYHLIVHGEYNDNVTDIIKWKLPICAAPPGSFQ